MSNIIPIRPNISIDDPDARILLKQVDILISLTDMHDMLIGLKRYEEADKYHIGYQAVRSAIDSYADDVRAKLR